LKKKKKTGKYYFTKEHEQAIIDYVSTEDIKIRTQLYVEYIGPAFNEMVDKIVYTYKFSSLPNIDSLREECKIWLMTILSKYDASKGSKAFSYFSVITKNWFIHKVKKTSQKHKREIQLEDMVKQSDRERMVSYNTYEKDRIDFEFWSSLYQEMEVWSEFNLKVNERRVLEAVQILFERSEDIEIFNKKAIYLYLREITGLNTKQVVNNLNKLRVKYRDFRKKWQEEIK